MLSRPFAACFVLAALVALPAAAQDFVPHKAAYAVNALEHGKLGASIGNYAFELKLTCEAYLITQRLRLDLQGGGGVTEEQSQMTESRDGRTLQFEHRSMVNGRQANLAKGEAVLDDKGMGQAHFSEPEGQTAALPAGTMFPIAMARATAQHAKAGDGGFNGLFFYGEKPKPPQAVNILIGRVPKRLVGLKIPDGAGALVKGRDRIYYRAGFFDADGKSKGEQAAFEMSSLMLDNGIELWGTHEEGDGGGIEYSITRLESVPLPTCK
jgi:EipB-like